MQTKHAESWWTEKDSEISKYAIYDGKKALFTTDALSIPQNGHVFTVSIIEDADSEKTTTIEMRIRKVQQVDMQRLHTFLDKCDTYESVDAIRDFPSEAVQVLQILLRHSPAVVSFCFI